MHGIKSQPCNICGAQIYFDPKTRSDKGKFIPIELRTHQPHNCKLDALSEFRKDISELKEKVDDMEKFINLTHIKERLEDLEKRLERFEGSR